MLLSKSPKSPRTAVLNLVFLQTCPQQEAWGYFNMGENGNRSLPGALPTVGYLLDKGQVCQLKTRSDIFSKEVVLQQFLYTYVFCILEKEMAIHSSTLAWKIPWTEEPDFWLLCGLSWFLCIIFIVMSFKSCFECVSEVEHFYIWNIDNNAMVLYIWFGLLWIKFWNYYPSIS